MLEATTGDRTDVEAEFAAVDELNARRRAIAATNPGGDTDLLLLAYPVIPENPLHELTPDLRGKVKKAEVSNVETRRPRSPEPPWPNEAA